VASSGGTRLAARTLHVSSCKPGNEGIRERLGERAGGSARYVREATGAHCDHQPSSEGHHLRPSRAPPDAAESGGGSAKSKPARWWPASRRTRHPLCDRPCSHRGASSPTAPRRHHGQGRFATPSAPPVTSRAQRPRRRTDAADTDHCVQSATRRSCLLPVIARAPRSARSCGAATAGCQQARVRPANDVRGRKAANPAETWPPTRHDLTILIDGR